MASCLAIGLVDLDISGKFCQSVRMFYPIRKFIAVIMAIWLPLFGGNALAESIAMHSKGGSCHAVPQQQNGHHSHPASAPQQPMHQAHLAANPDLSSSHPDQQDSSCKNHAICHLACCGYVAGSVSVIVAAQQADRIFAPYLDAPRTLTLPLFDPPPITRA